MRTIERKARVMDRDGLVFPVADGVYRVFDPDDSEVFTVDHFRCDCCARSCAHILAAMAYEYRVGLDSKP